MNRPRLKTIGPRLKPIDTRRVKPPSKETDSFYNSEAWKEVRESVLQRDRYACVRCGRIMTRLFVDHIIEIKDGGQQLDPINLQTLCGSCHTTKTHAARIQRHQL
jgi:5-methylcytosine-specific restriction protein A